MYSKTQWIAKLGPVGLILLIAVSPLAAQTRALPGMQLGFMEPDAARDLFNQGSTMLDNAQYERAVGIFREVLRRYPKNEIADKSAYYLIRALADQGKTKDALDQVKAFEKTFPKSGWMSDVQEMQVKLTNQASPEQMARLASTPVPPRAPQAPPAPPAPQTPFGRGIDGSIQTPFGPMPRAGRADENPELTLQQEVLRVLFENNPDRAIEIATERLKADPSDPLVVANLYMLANSKSDKALPMLVVLAKTSPNSKVRQDAIFWIGRSRLDKDALTDLLVGLVPSMTSDDDSSAIANSLSQLNTPKAINALSGMASDKSKSEKIRLNAIRGIGQSRLGNRSALLEEAYRGSMDNPRVRRQVIVYLGQSKDPQDVTILANVASNDPDISVRRDAVTFLGQMKTPEAFKALENLLNKKP